MDFIDKLLASPIEIIAVVGFVVIGYKLLDFLKFLFTDVIASIRSLSEVVSEDLGLAKELKEQRDRDYQYTLTTEEKKAAIHANLQALVEASADSVKKKVNEGFHNASAELGQALKVAHDDHQKIIETVNTSTDLIKLLLEKKFEELTIAILVSVEKSIHELGNNFQNVAIQTAATIQHIATESIEETLVIHQETAPLDPSKLPKEKQP